MPLRRPSGFTLIELAVVIAVIGLLVAGAFTSFSAMRINAKLRETHQNVQRVEQLLQTFVLRNGR
ncbi:MAG: type II secretion system protein, partial [Gammaproteobacteria bacterium]